MTTAMTISAPAKINLGLTVLRRRNDGYHEISSVMQQISLADKICLEPRRKRGFSFFCTDPALSGEENLVYRAAALLSREVRRELPGVAITLYKQIPAGAGLGGGSSDAAAALRGLNSFWGLGLEPAGLAERGRCSVPTSPLPPGGRRWLRAGRKLALPHSSLGRPGAPAAVFLSTRRSWRLSPALRRPPLEPSSKRSGMGSGASCGSGFRGRDQYPGEGGLALKP